MATVNNIQTVNNSLASEDRGTLKEILASVLPDKYLRFEMNQGYLWKFDAPLQDAKISIDMVVNNPVSIKFFKINSAGELVDSSLIWISPGEAGDFMCGDNGCSAAGATVLDFICGCGGGKTLMEFNISDDGVTTVCKSESLYRQGSVTKQMLQLPGAARVGTWASENWRGDSIESAVAAMKTLMNGCTHMMIKCENFEHVEHRVVDDKDKTGVLIRSIETTNHANSSVPNVDVLSYNSMEFSQQPSALMTSGKLVNIRSGATATPAFSIADDLSGSLSTDENHLRYNYNSNVSRLPDVADGTFTDPITNLNLPASISFLPASDPNATPKLVSKPVWGARTIDFGFNRDNRYIGARYRLNGYTPGFEPTLPFIAWKVFAKVKGNVPPCSLDPDWLDAKNAVSAKQALVFSTPKDGPPDAYGNPTPNVAALAALKVAVDALKVLDEFNSEPIKRSNREHINRVVIALRENNLALPDGSRVKFEVSPVLWSGGKPLSGDAITYDIEITKQDSDGVDIALMTLLPSNDTKHVCNSAYTGYIALSKAEEIMSKVDGEFVGTHDTPLYAETSFQPVMNRGSAGAGIIA